MIGKLDVNPIPYLTWTWLKINKDSVNYDFALAENGGKEIEVPEGVKISAGKSVSTQLPGPVRVWTPVPKWYIWLRTQAVLFLQSQFQKAAV